MRNGLINQHPVSEPIHAGISCNLDLNILQAALPLFQEERIAAIEWSFDTLYQYRAIPDWFNELIDEFAQANRLIGHGVYYSMLSAEWTPDQQNWLNELKKNCDRFNFNHITEHFGFFSGSNFHQGAPLPVPYSPTTLAIGQDRLKRLAAACQCPVGIENLAFSFSPADVRQQGEFLNELLEPVNGFLILDLHNLYCQLHNFEFDFEELIAFFPLDRVREIHISGGSWEPAIGNTTRKIRRDTHDNAVPPNVFELLELTVQRCPNLRFVMLEQMGKALSTPESKSQFRADFIRLENILKGRYKTSNYTFLPDDFEIAPVPIEDDVLLRQQKTLSEILENSENPAIAKTQLKQSTLACSAWKIESWSDDLLATAMGIAKKWKHGFV